MSYSTIQTPSRFGSPSVAPKMQPEIFIRTLRGSLIKHRGSIETKDDYEAFFHNVIQDALEYDSLISDQSVGNKASLCSEWRTSYNKIKNMIYLKTQNKILDETSYRSNILFSEDMSITIVLMARLKGGMTDRQNRVGSKFGGGGVSSEQHAERSRKERLRQLALESIDLAKDPYLMRNHLGTYECKLCLTLHTTEGNYLAHTQGKKHQMGLAKRAAMEKKLAPFSNNNDNQLCSFTSNNPFQKQTSQQQQQQMNKNRVKIGRPGYQVSKSRHPDTNQRCMSFELYYPELDPSDNIQPRQRFMSPYEQRIESPPDKRYQYLLVACHPYETVAFKVPNEPIDKSQGKFITHWDSTEKKFNLTFYFLDKVHEETATSS